jgi:RNA polymerase sigma factor (sigma-70 family)
MPSAKKPNTPVAKARRNACIILTAMDLESSFELIEKARAGDSGATDRLLGRYRPRISRWTTGRIPGYARDFTDTDDIVQIALIGLVKNFESFEYQGEWSLQAYLRKTVVNEIRKQIRKRTRMPDVQALPESLASSELCPYETAVGKEVFARYNAALETLTPIEQEAVIAWVEMGCSHKEIMLLVDKPSVDAARMFVTRALEKLAKVMAASLGRGTG